MPTYEAIGAGAMLLVVWGLTRWDRWLGVVLAGMVGAASAYAAVAWGVWFGGPVIVVGTGIGLLLGWTASGRKSARPSAEP